MELYLFRLRLAEMYHSDSRFGRFPAKYEKLGNVYIYSKWAAFELDNFITTNLYPRKTATLLEYYNLTTEFLSKMEYFAQLNENTHHIFEIASAFTIDVLDWLEAMN